MIKKLLLIIVLFSNVCLFSQNADGYVVTNENDTIKCKFFVSSNMFKKDILYFSSLNRKVKILNKKNEEKTYRPYELISFNIKSINEDYKFISVQDDNYERFFHEVFEGRISFLVIYEGSISQYNNNDTQYYYLLKDNVLTDLDVGNLREVIGELLKDYPQLYKDWMDKKYKTKDYLDVIKIYNEYFKNKKD